MKPNELSVRTIQRNQLYLVQMREVVGLSSDNNTVKYLATPGLQNCVAVVMIRPNTACVLTHIPGELHTNDGKIMEYLNACLTRFNVLLGQGIPDITLGDLKEIEDDGELQNDTNYFVLIATGLDLQLKDDQSLIYNLKEKFGMQFEDLIYDSNNVVVQLEDAKGMYIYQKLKPNVGKGIAAFTIPEQGNAQANGTEMIPA